VRAGLVRDDAGVYWAWRGWIAADGVARLGLLLVRSTSGASFLNMMRPQGTIVAVGVTVPTRGRPVPRSTRPATEIGEGSVIETDNHLASWRAGRAKTALLEFVSQ
jgi:hypothetical protein